MKNNIKYILNKIEDNIKKHSSKEKNIKLIIVTKSQIIDDIKILINLGYKSFGENYNYQLLLGTKIDHFVRNL